MFTIYMFSSIADDNEGSSSDTAPLFQMAGDGKNTDDITIPMLFLFSKEGNIILDAMREYLEVEVLLSDKAKDRDLEGESGEPRPLENDSQKQVSKEQSIPQEEFVSAKDSDIMEASPSQIDDLYSSSKDHSPNPTEGEISPEIKQPHSEASHDFVEQSQTLSESPEESKSERWDSKVQPMESILADWKEDIEAFEMMDKDEL